MDFEQLKKECEGCHSCELGRLKTNSVFERGSRNAALMFVGEAPGEQEYLQGRPFVGPAGQLLDKYLLSVGIDPEEVYICNVLKCRPPHNRDPLPEEQEACMEYLRGQVRLIKPQIIVCLGRVAAMRLISPDFKITKEHGVFHKKGNFLITAVYTRRLFCGILPKKRIC